MCYAKPVNRGAIYKANKFNEVYNKTRKHLSVTKSFNKAKQKVLKIPGKIIVHKWKGTKETIGTTYNPKTRYTIRYHKTKKGWIRGQYKRYN